jgi:ABC-2 type transport system ATP-binding protein
MEEAQRQCDRLAIIDHGRLVAQGAPADLVQEHGAASLDDVFAAATGHDLGDEGGRLRDVRAVRRLTRRLG